MHDWTGAYAFAQAARECGNGDSDAILTPLLKQRASAVTEILTPQQKKILIDIERAGQKSKTPAHAAKPNK